MSTPAQIRATTNYIRNHTKRYTLQCNKKKDADIIEFLNSKSNYTAYLKEIIRKDMEEEA